MKNQFGDLDLSGSEANPGAAAAAAARVTTTIRLPRQMRDALKLAAVQRGLNLSEIYEEGVRMWAEANDVELPL